MIKSLEQMAREKIEVYTKPLHINGKKISDGWPIHIAARKAAAAWPTFESVIHKVSKEMRG